MNDAPDPALFSVPSHESFLPSACGDWSEDNRRGREACIKLANHVGETGDMPMVGLVLNQIYSSDAPEKAGIKAGFTCAIAALMARG